MLFKISKYFYVKSFAVIRKLKILKMFSTIGH